MQWVITEGKRGIARPFNIKKRTVDLDHIPYQCILSNKEHIMFFVLINDIPLHKRSFWTQNWLLKTCFIDPSL